MTTAIKFLAQINDVDVKPLITEAKEGKPKGYFIEGPFLQADMKNRNGRIYPLETMIKECTRYVNTYVIPNRALGELGHPDTTTVNPERVSHIITHLEQDGSNFMGRAKILDTPMGMIVKNFMEEGVVLGVSSRGFGSVHETAGSKVVGNDFQLSTVDIVHDPSGYDCFVQGIMESKEYYWDKGILVEKQYDEAKAIIKNSRTEAELFEAIDKFFKSL